MFQRCFYCKKEVLLKGVFTVKRIFSPPTWDAIYIYWKGNHTLIKCLAVFRLCKHTSTCMHLPSYTWVYTPSSIDMYKTIHQPSWYTSCSYIMRSFQSCVPWTLDTYRESVDDTGKCRHFVVTTTITTITQFNLISYHVMSQKGSGKEVISWKKRLYLARLT